MIFQFRGFAPQLVAPILVAWHHSPVLAHLEPVLVSLSQLVFRVYFLCDKKNNTCGPDLHRASITFAQSPTPNLKLLLEKISTQTNKNSAQKLLQNTALWDPKHLWYSTKEKDQAHNNATRTLLWYYECVINKKVFGWESCTLEHIFPQENTQTWEATSLNKYLHTLGNLILLTQTDNTAASNRDFATKKAIYKNSSFNLPRRVASLLSWDRQAVVDQRIHLVQFITNALVGPITK